MVPKHSFLQDISSCLISIVPEKFYDKVEAGSIILKKSQSFSFCEEGILVKGETTPLKSDLVIFATGFRGDKKLKDIFVSPPFQDCIAGSPNAKLPLYRYIKSLMLKYSLGFKLIKVTNSYIFPNLIREMIHPQIPQLAVIGFSESVSNLLVSEMGSRWLAELLAGKFKLPSRKEMEKDINEWDKCMKEYSGPYYMRSCLAVQQIWYNDQLCKDMGWNPKRKKGFLAEFFQPYGPMDYVSSS